MSWWYVFIGWVFGFACGWSWWVVLLKLEETKEHPDCFGRFRSPQWDAEGNCHSCKFDSECYKKFKTNDI